MVYNYYPKGVCSRQMLIDIENGVINSIKFIGGCSGNLQGVAKLATGRTIDEVITLLKGIQCRNNTSCPDQLATALMKFKEEHNK